jgi:hypothetical protein
MVVGWQNVTQRHKTKTLLNVSTQTHSHTMKLFIQTWIPIAICILVMACCKPESNNPSLVGTWDWIASSGGIAGGTQTPTTLGYRQHYVFSESRFQFYQGSERLQQGSYDQNCAANNTCELSLENSDVELSYRIVNDSLFIDELCYDCFSNVYLRRN